MDKLTTTLDLFLSSVDGNDWPNITAIEQANADQNTITLSLKVEASLSYLKGHFPDKPVVPGVVQVHWATLLANELFTITEPFTKMENVKFQSMLLPEQTVELNLRNNSEKQQVIFNYRLNDSLVSEGKLYFHG